MSHSTAKIRWSTPNAEQELAYIARVSNLQAKPEDPFERLLRYLFRKKHWSPFEMVNVCVEITTPRDIGRQLLRHKSLHFQEFSGRYAEYEDLQEPREARLQDHENRQNSLPCTDPFLKAWWTAAVEGIVDLTTFVYKEALRRGIAKEVARTILPEGLVPSRLFVNGNLRSWIHYFEVRCTPETQKEHRELAEAIRAVVLEEFPTLKKVLGVE